MSEGNSPRKGGGLQRLETLRSTLGREKPRGRPQHAEEEAQLETLESGEEGQDLKPEEQRDHPNGPREQNRTRNRSSSEPRSSGSKGKKRKATPRESVTRITVDLPTDQYAFLRTFVARSGSDGMSVVRAMLMELQKDQALADRVVQHLVDERIKAATR